MGFFLTLRIALRALAKNKLCAGLTVLGVVIGIAAVTAMVSIGQSASELVRGQFESIGTTVIVVFPGNQRQGGVRAGAGADAHRQRFRRDRQGVPLDSRQHAARRRTGPHHLWQHQLQPARSVRRRDRLSGRRQLGACQRRIFHRARRQRLRESLRHRAHAGRQAVSDERPDQPDRSA